jgi:hypothetical protein
MYRAGSLRAVAEEISIYNLDLAGELPHLELSSFVTDSRILPESRLSADSTQNSVLLLVNTDRTENISRGSY